MGNEYYWRDKENRANIAKCHTEWAEKNYLKEIRKCSEETILYENYCAVLTNKEKSTKLSVFPMDSVSAILENNFQGKTAVLNFASYKNPGGGFLEGSRAQEECLCHDSFLYNVLSRHKDYYNYNRQKLNKALYTNRALYSPNVLFFKNKRAVPCDVITCAAPNYSAYSKYNLGGKEENSKVLRSRIRFILSIAANNKIENLILGAYGCGVFGQDPTEVATIFKEELLNDFKYFKNVIFAIPTTGNNPQNYDAFFKVMERKNEADVFVG